MMKHAHYQSGFVLFSVLVLLMLMSTMLLLLLAVSQEEAIMLRYQKYHNEAYLKAENQLAIARKQLPLKEGDTKINAEGYQIFTLPKRSNNENNIIYEVIARGYNHNVHVVISAGFAVSRHSIVSLWWFLQT